MIARLVGILYVWVRNGFALLFLFMLTLFFTPVTEFFHEILIVDEQPHDGDALVILSTNEAHGGETGVLTYATLIRIRKGVELIRSNNFNQIVLVGGNRMAQTGTSIAALMRAELLSHGVAPEKIRLQDAILGDFDYYDNLMQITEQRPDIEPIDMNRSVVVTSSHNTFRIKSAFNQRGFNPTIVSAEPYALAPANWHYRWDNFRDVANEYVAILLFYALGRM